MLYDYSDVYTGMADTISYIRQLLSISPTMDLMPDDSADPEPILIETDLSKIDYRPIEDITQNESIWAIDGGQGTIVRNNVFIAAVCRAGYVKFKDRIRIEEMTTPLRLINLTYENYNQIYRQTHFACHSKEPAFSPSFSETLGELRRLYEELVILNCLDKISQGDLILLDGSSRDGKNGFMSALMKSVKAKEAALVGVSKASGILWQGGANLTAVLKEEGERRMPGIRWHAKVGKAGKDNAGRWKGDIYVAKLNPHSPNAFRVDIARDNTLSTGLIFSILSKFSTDPFFLGYPYPLAAVHQMVRLTADELVAFSLRLQDEALQAGINQSGWNMLFEDYHKILNFDVSQERQLH
jgi:hypothetical protein